MKLRHLLVVLLAAACGDDDGALDAATDAGPDTGVDARDGGADAGDTGVDGSSDAGFDAADAAVDLPWFEDVTEAAGLGFERVAADDWASLPDRMSGGVCVLDVDGEGPLDLFFAMRPAAGSRLYVASEPLAYTDQTATFGLDGTGDALGCLAFDAEGDGDDDLLVTGLGTLELWLREGATFVRADVLPAIDSRDMMTSAAAADLDDDGDLDLLVAGFLRLDEAFAPDPETCVAEGCAANIGAWPQLENLMLMRDATGSYADGARTAAPELWMTEPTLAITAPDLDADGRVDVFVGNDLGRGGIPNHPMVRDGEDIFRDDAIRLGMDRKASGLSTCTMGVAHGDLDGNGRMDLVTTSFERDPSGVFLCFSGSPCEERGEAWGVGDAELSFRWGVALADFDLDGWLDVIESTGHLVTEEEGAPVGLVGPLEQPPNLFRNRGGTRLDLVVADPSDALAVPRQTRGIAIVDLDDDGRMDVVLAPNRGRPGVLRNVRDTSGHWLRVSLEGRPPNTGGVGALVTVETADGTRQRQRLAGEGYLGSFDPRLHFGLPRDGVARVTVRWPNGETSVVEDVAVDTEVTITE